MDKAVETSEVEELERRVVVLERENSIETDEIVKIKENAKEESFRKELTEKAISDFNRSLLRAYSNGQEISKAIINFSRIKKKSQDSLDLMLKEINKTACESKILVSSRINNNVKRNRLEGLKRKLDVTIENIKTLDRKYELSKKNYEESDMIFKETHEKHEKIVMNIRKKIVSVESLIEKVQTQEHLLILRRCKVRNDLDEVYEKSKEIHQMIKDVDVKTLELDAEIEKSMKNQQEIQRKILELREEQEKGERLRYLKEKILNVRK